MPESFMVVKGSDGKLSAATDYDLEILKRIPSNKPYKVDVKQVSGRSYQHHKLFFGGLLPFAYDYWQPVGGVMTEAEQYVVRDFARKLSELVPDDMRILFFDFAEEYITQFSSRRGQKIGAVVKDMEAFRSWLTVEAGFFELYVTPGGYVKVPRSISFSKMDQDEFSKFYKACFDVVWNMILSSKFESEEQAEKAILDFMDEFG